MAIALATQGSDNTRRYHRLRVKLTMSGSYVTSGDTLDLSAITNPNFIPGGKFGSNPATYSVDNFPGGYTAEIIPGTLLTNWLLKVYSAGGTELAASGYPAAITAATDIRITLGGFTGKV